MKLNNDYFLLRHGQTIYQKEQRRVNYPAKENFSITLTEEGKEMIKQVAEGLKGKAIDLIFASPFLRTKQSAEIVAGILGIGKIIYDHRLVDINLGEFSGRPQEEHSNFFIDENERFDKRPAGGESWRDVMDRASSFLADVEKGYKGKNILIVSHGDPVWLMAGLLSGLKEEEFLSTRKTEKNNLYPEVGELIKP